ncbi:hypothetical protein [Phenylobacterium sp.]|nr:hypothetical protein [Phenylobacterium sp.]MDP3854171.1 hypothetical protein [Phenylobacterium sp.]
MSRDREEEMLAVARLWEERFGEPPPILTDPDLMRSIMDGPEREAAA